MPIASPVATVGPTCRKLPISAAPRAGIRKPKVNSPDPNWIIGAARIATSPLTSDATTKLSAASRSGE